MTPQHFKQRWEGTEGFRLVAFPSRSFDDVDLSAEARILLTEAGLPHEAAPFLTFEPPNAGTLTRASELWRLGREFDHFRVIGSNGSGDPVCLDTATHGHVVYLNHDNDFFRELMSSSATQLAECLLEFRALVSACAAATDPNVAQLMTAFSDRLAAIESDSAAREYWQWEAQCFCSK